MSSTQTGPDDGKEEAIALLCKLGEAITDLPSVLKLISTDNTIAAIRKAKLETALAIVNDYVLWQDNHTLSPSPPYPNMALYKLANTYLEKAFTSENRPAFY